MPTYQPGGGEITYNFLKDGGEMGRLTRAFDWAGTTIGTPDQWPGSLRTILGIVLHSAFPMFLFWGEDLVCFYNEAFKPSLGVDGKHPAVGKKGKDVWPEIWDFIGPLIAQVMTTGEPVWFEDQLVPFYRNGKIEDIYWTFSYSPAYDDGAIAGVIVTCVETTDKVQARKALEESEERFRTMAEGSGILIAVADENGNATYFNNAWVGVTGRPMDQLLQRGWADLVHPDDHDRIIQAYLDAVRQKTGFAWELRILNKNGGYTWLLAQGPARFKPDGTFAGHISSCTDITDQKQVQEEWRKAENRVKEREEQIRSLVESAPFPMAVFIGRDLQITLANQAMFQIMGKGDQIVGKSYKDLLPELGSQSIFDEIAAVFDTGKPFHARNRHLVLEENGQSRPVYFNYSFTPLFDTRGHVYGIMNTGADVTDLNLAKKRVEENEKNIRNTILKAPVAICIFRGPEYVVEIANDRMLELWGVGAAAALHKPIFEALPEVRDQGFEALLSRVYHTGKAISVHDHPVLLPRNGKMHQEYVSFLYEAEIGASGSITGILAVAIIVTDQVKARHQIEHLVAERTEALAEANRHLERSNAELSQFAYIASHDLQEPIRKISTYVQLLENNIKESLSDQSKNYLSKIKTAGHRMVQLIRDVLAYSELSKSAPAFESVDLQHVLREVESEFELLIEQKGARIYFAGLPILSAIPLQMTQLFGNLVSNALKYAKADVPPVVTITSQAEGDRYHIQVEDNGIGFDPQYAEQIFSIFQRLHRKTEYSGTGIGLALCKKIVENHHGGMYATSQPGLGSTFHILLPAWGAQ